MFHRDHIERGTVNLVVSVLIKGTARWECLLGGIIGQGLGIIGINVNKKFVTSFFVILVLI
jgi:hypothetical protein